jgi:histidinol phosphatase-like PHP family hydrolase
MAAMMAGLDGIAFTDHHRLVSRVHMENLRQRYTHIKLFTGIEITADREDWLVLGVYDPRLESNEWNYPDLRRLVQDLGGFIALAHPFRYRTFVNVDLAACPPDGIELHSYNTPPAREADIRDLARQHQLRLLQNSDSHWNATIGQYFNTLPDVLDGDADLVRLLMELPAG